MAQIHWPGLASVDASSKALAGQCSGVVASQLDQIPSEAYGKHGHRGFPESHGLFGHISDLIAKHIAEEKERMAPEQRPGTVEQEESSYRDFEEAGQ